jgi:hypothetical protein
MCPLDAAVVITLVEQRCLQIAPEGAHRYSYLADAATALLGDVLHDASRYMETGVSQATTKRAAPLVRHRPKSLR